jgi:ribosome-associated toxin RatA of RatAB toxin-antitoxin module
MEVRKTVLVGHSAERMFDLIEAAEHYPDFLPWCAAATIVERDSNVVAADVTVDFHGVRFHFRTRNPKRPPEWMALRLEHGPFHRFEGEWKLTPLAADGCRIDFLLHYDFKRGITGKLAAPVFDRIANTLVDAFVAQADRVYAGLAAPTASAQPSATTGATTANQTLPSAPTVTPPPSMAAPDVDPLNAAAAALPDGSPNRSETS